MSEPESEPKSGVVPVRRAETVAFSVIEHELALADTPEKVRSLDGKLAVIQELFRKDRRALGDQNRLAILRIRAQRRGGELLAATVRQGRPSKRSHDATFLLPEDIDKHVSSRWQALAGIAEKVLDDYLRVQTEGGGEVTTAGFSRFAEGAKDDVHFSSVSDEWFTPKWVVDLVLAVLGEVDLDPCSNSKESPNVPAKHLFTQEDDGLARPWFGRVYMNPPYGRELANWTDKLATEFEAGRVKEAIALVPSRTDTEWFRRLRSYPRCFLFGRLQFSGHENSAPFPSMMAYLGNRRNRFMKTCGSVGDVYELVRD